MVASKEYNGVVLTLVLVSDGVCCKLCYFKDIDRSECWTRNTGFGCKGGYWMQKVKK